MDATIRSKSITLSLLVHALIFLFLFFTYLTTSNPPFPEAGGGGGVLVNIGYQESAAGDEQPLSENISSQPQPEQVKETAVNQPDEELLTQDAEESAPVIVKEKRNDTPKPIIKPKENVVVTKPKPVEPPKTADPRQMYQGKNTNSTSQGTAQTGKGDQGSKDGDPFANQYGKPGDGSGSGGGTGGGQGGGNGIGIGPGSGPGINFNLKGRNAITKIKPDDNSQEEGVVVVAITVDKDGNVINAIPGGEKGSTTTSINLYNKARVAALKWKFNKSPDGAETQKGTITMIFRNQ